MQPKESALRAARTTRFFAAVRTLMALDLMTGGLALAVRSVLAKNISPAEYGLYAIVYALVVLLGSILAPDAAYNAFIASARACGRGEEVTTWVRTALRVGLAAGCVLAVALAVLAPTLATTWLRNPAAAIPLLLAVPGLALAPLWYSSIGALAGLDRFDLSASARLSFQLATLVFMSCAIWVAGTYLSVFAALSLGFIVAGLFSTAAMLRATASFGGPTGSHWLTAAPAGGHLRRLARFYAPLLAKAVGSQLLDKVGLFVIAGTLPLALAGAYGAAAPLAAFSIVFSRWTYGPLATHFAEQHGGGEAASTASLLWKSTALFASVSCLIALGMAILAPTLLAVIYSQDYVVVTDALAILLFGAAMGGMGGPAVRLLMAEERTGAVATVSLLTGLLSAGLAYAGAMTMGVVGVAAATTLAWAAQAAWYLALATRGHRGRGSYLLLVVPIALGGVLYGGFRTLAGSPGFVLQAFAAAAAALTYVALVWATPLVSSSDLRQVATAMLSRRPPTDSSKGS